MEGFVGKPSAIPAAKAFRGRRAEIRMRLYRALLISLVMLHRRMETVFLELVHIMLRFLETLTGQDAFPLLVDLQHMKFGFFPGPSEHGLKHVGDIIHEIDRIIPTNNQVARLQSGFRLFLCDLDRTRQQFWNGCVCHKRKLKEESTVVEPWRQGLNRVKNLIVIRLQTRQNQNIITAPEAGQPLKSLNIQGCISSKLCYF